MIARLKLETKLTEEHYKMRSMQLNLTQRGKAYQCLAYLRILWWDKQKWCMVAGN